MDFISTRSLNPVSIEEALLSGTAKDGGLYLPSEIPKIDRNDFLEADDYVSFSNSMLSPFFRDSSLEECLQDIVTKSFNFPVQMLSLINI